MAAASVAQRQGWLDTLREKQPHGSVRGWCRVLDLNRAGYYECRRKRTAQEQECEPMQRIRSLHAQYPRYGYRRIHALLKREGSALSPGQVWRRMHQGNCLAQPTPRRYVKTTQTQDGQPLFANLAKEMQVTDLNQLWRADLTYVHVQKGMVYLACILDAYSRKCVGWHLSSSLHAQLPLHALEMAISQRQPGPGLVHHSDRGVQYTPAMSIASV